MAETSPTLVFGYGGLILPANRAITLGTEVEAAPAKVSGLARLWGFQASQYRLTSLSLTMNANSQCAGVLFPVTQEQLMQLDNREYGYDRMQLAKGHVHILQPQGFALDGTVFTYVARAQHLPSTANPIVQSEVDVVITGCLIYGDEFAKDVVRTTSGWDTAWLDDREAPRYPWPLRDSNRAQDIDRILKETVPAAFDKRERGDPRPARNS